jgi:TolA-binding protein
LADTMPVGKMEEAINNAGTIHPDHVNQIMQYALENIAKEGVEGARDFDFGNFQKYYDAALDAIEDGAIAGKAAKAGIDLSQIRVRPPSDNITNVRDANFQYPKTIGNQTLDINSITGGVRIDQQEQTRINRLANQISSPEGYISRIIVDQNNNVIEGQHRLEALRQLGAKEVPVYKIEELADTMPVGKMEEAINNAGKIHPDHVNQIMQYALENIAKDGVGNARDYDFGNFQKYYDAALDAIEDGATAGKASKAADDPAKRDSANLGYAQGGAVRAYDPLQIENIMSSINAPRNYASGGSVLAYNPGRVDAIINQFRGAV